MMKAPQRSASFAFFFAAVMAWLCFRLKELSARRRGCGQLCHAFGFAETA